MVDSVSGWLCPEHGSLPVRAQKGGGGPAGSGAGGVSSPPVQKHAKAPGTEAGATGSVGGGNSGGGGGDGSGLLGAGLDVAGAGEVLKVAWAAAIAKAKAEVTAEAEVSGLAARAAAGDETAKKEMAVALRTRENRYKAAAGEATYSGTPGVIRKCNAQTGKCFMFNQGR